MNLYRFTKFIHTIKKCNHKYLSTKIKTVTDEWYIKENNYYKIGLTNNINDILYIDIENNENGNEFKQNNTIVIIETVKAVGEINSPFDCKLIEVNNKVQEDIELVNNDPENEENWIIKIQPNENIKNPDKIINTLKI